MKEEVVNYLLEGQSFKGFWAYPPTFASAKQYPVVLVAHAWMGQDELARDQARMLAKLGYIGFALDLYGNGKEVHTPEEATALMLPLFENRQLLQKRAEAALTFVSQSSFVDLKKIGAIGFCFGGLAMIELLRSGAPVKGVATFHAVLGQQMGDHKAKTVPIAKGIKGSILVLHGHDDPLVSPADIAAFQKEFTEAGIDWQMNIYGHTSHAFTNPMLKDPKSPLHYQPRSAARAFEAMRAFFEEEFGENEKKTRDHRQE